MSATDMSSLIFFEKQEGSLCAQHAVNALLQGNYTSPVDLSELAAGLDAAEAAIMNPVGSSTFTETRTSSNVREDGFFSVQVLSKALEIWGLELLSLNAPEAASARMDPTTERAFVLNCNQHWFTLRRFEASGIWFNLNSTLERPERVSNTYLGMLLQQLRLEGYTIFVIRGDAFPQCPADYVDEEVLLPSSTSTVNPNEDPELSIAISNSLTTFSTHRTDDTIVDMDEVRRKRLARFG